jgi:hypothetical protein
LNIKKVTLPFAGIILGPPSTLKTIGLTMLKVWPQTFYTDSFSPKSLVSHSSTLTSEELQEVDMLPRWKNKLVLLPELSPVFTAKDEDLAQLLGILTRVLDGQGYLSNSGVHGQRGYDEKMMFVLAGASVEIPRKVYKVLGYLGPKLYFLRNQKEQSKAHQQRIEALTEDFNEKQQQIQTKLFDYLSVFSLFAANQSIGDYIYCIGCYCNDNYKFLGSYTICFITPCWNSGDKKAIASFIYY